MHQESVMKYIKAFAGVLALTGMVISPEHQQAIGAGFMALYSVITGVQAWIKQKQGK